MDGSVTGTASDPERAGEAAKAGERKAAIEPGRAGNPAAVVALTYVGTVVGAGFASGQEVLQFFTAQGRPGLLAMVLAAGLFGWVGASIMLYGRRFGAESHLPVVQHVAGERTRAASLLDGIITFFLLGTTAAMVSGAGSIASEQFGISRWLGGGLLAAAAVLTVLAGVHRVIESISIVAPFLLLSVLGLAAAAVALNPDPPAAVSRMFTVSPLSAPAAPDRAGLPAADTPPGGPVDGPDGPGGITGSGLTDRPDRLEQGGGPGGSGGSPTLRELSAISSLLPYLGRCGWLVAGLLYVAYNLVLSVSVLAPLGKEARSRNAVVAGGYLGGAALMLGVFAIQSAMLALLPAGELRALDIPMLGVARRLSPVLGIAYSAVVMAEVYTTAVANLYGFAARLVERSWSWPWPRPWSQSQSSPSPVSPPSSRAASLPSASPASRSSSSPLSPVPPSRFSPPTRLESSSRSRSSLSHRSGSWSSDHAAPWLSDRSASGLSRRSRSSPGPVSSRGETAPTRPFRLVVAASGVAAGLAAGFGFAQVVGTLYPLMGLAGLALVALVIRARVREAL